MKFSVPCVREFLIKKKEVYTVRSYLAEDGKYFFPDIERNCERTFIKQVFSAGDLCGYDKKSGFKDVQSWWNVIMRMYKDEPKFLYLVVKK